LDQKEDAEHDQRRMDHDAAQLRPEDGVDDDEEDHHRCADPGRRARGEETGDQHAGDQWMRRFEADPGGKSEGQPGELQGEQAYDPGEKRNRKQEQGVLQKEDDAGEDQGEEGQRVGQVIVKLLRLDQEQLRSTVQRSPELSHVEHCSRGSGELGPDLDAPSKVGRRDRANCVCYPYSVFPGTHVKLSRHTLRTPILLAAGLLATVVAASAADTSWTLTGAQQPGTQDRPVWSIAVAPAHPSVFLEATQGRGVLRSADSGATWTSAITGIDNAWVVRFDPLQPATAYAGTQADGFYKSVDEGKTWVAQSQGLNSMDVRSIAVDSGLLLAGTGRGVYYSNDGAGSWHSLGLETLNVAAVAVLPKTNGPTLFAGADNGNAVSGYLLKSEGLGGSGAVVKGNFPGDAVVASLAVASAPSGGTDPPVLAGTSQGLFRSDDRGVTWNSLNGLPSTDFNLALFNPANPDQIYVGSDGDQGNGGVFRSLDRGASWGPLGAGLPAKPRVTALALQPLNPAQVVAATWNPTDGSAGAYRIEDPAATLAGGTPTAAANASRRASATPRASAPTPAPVRRSTSSPAYATYALAVAVLVALGAVILARRWRMRREDRRIYRP